VWVTDCACTDTRATSDTTQGHQVFKFSSDGKLLMTIGRAGGRKEPGYFWQPNDILVAPNGDIFVAEGHSSRPDAAARLLKFSPDGKFIKAWGHKGTGPGELDQPHALAMDSRGRLFVGDRGNNRIIIMDQNFNDLGYWYQFSRPSGLYIDKNDVLYVADSESGSVAPEHKDWMRGIRIGSAKDGRIVSFIPDTDTLRGTSGPEGVAADARGNVYGAEVGQKALKRHVRRGRGSR
jgi:sugar lactone lactonase YvrE